MLDQIHELAEILAPRMFGKKLLELNVSESIGKAQGTERYKVFAEAQKLRLDAIRLAKSKGRAYENMAWPELLEHCKEIIEREYPRYQREPGEEG